MSEPLRARRARQRGSTYTMLVVASSFLIVITSSLLLQSSGHVLEHSAMQARGAQAREAAFAGVRWAARHADQSGAPEVEATLRLHQVQVDVVGRPGGGPDERRVTSKAKAQGIEAEVTARLVRVEGAWRLAGAQATVRER